MKVRNILSTVAVSALGALSLTSCNDFLTIYPTDKTVGKDMWKTAAQVDENRDGAYQAMQNYSIVERAIIWGAFRSDELIRQSSYVNNDLENISAANLLPQNGYNNWGSFYSVINRCNLVLDKAPGVLQEDPDFLEGNYREIRAQMLALRSLCYFYLVRSFRDVPYSVVGYERDDQPMNLPQSTPAEVLQHCIDDLQEAEKYIMRSGSYGRFSIENKYRFTTESVWALLADIYLWRASMNHDNADYQKVVEYADKVIASREAYHKKTLNDNVNTGTDENGIYLTPGILQRYENFNYANGYEVLFCIPYDGSNAANLAMGDYYYKNGENGTNSRLMATKLFARPAADANSINSNSIYMNSKDMRYWDNCYSVGSADVEGLNIRKQIAESNTSQYFQKKSDGNPQADSRLELENYKTLSRNWVIYRLTDVMLMKAEALTAMASADDDTEHLRAAFNLVKTVNDRSMDYSKYAAGDSLQYANYGTKDQMELLVLTERARELCFEGKRWYDLMRYAYRHMEGVKSNELMANQKTFANVYPSMLQLVKRKYTSGGDAVSYKIKTEPYLYFPIQEGQIKVSGGLIKQNPAYDISSTIDKK